MSRRKIVGIATLAATLFSAAVVSGYLVKSGAQNGRFTAALQATRLSSFPPRTTEVNFEKSNFQSMRRRGSPLRHNVNPDFSNLLRAATGYEVPKLADFQSQLMARRNLGLTLHGSDELISTRYNDPPLLLHSLFSRSQPTGQRLLVILPGFGSSAAKILGLDNLDYHSHLGKSALSWGYDVLIPDFVSDPGIAAAINVRLTMRGAQLAGLELRQTCNTISWLMEREKYEHIVVYGLRFGGRLADMLGHLCETPLDRIVVDGMPIPWREAIWEAAISDRLAEPQLFQYLAPLLARSSYLDFMLHSPVKKVYLLDSKSLKIAKGGTEHFFRSARATGNEHVILVPRQNNFPFADPIQIQQILESDWAGLEALALTPR